MAFVSCGASKEEHKKLQGNFKKIKVENSKLKSEATRLKKELESIKFGAERLFKSGNNHYKNKRYRESKKAFETLLKKHPASDEAIKCKPLLAKIKPIVKRTDRIDKAKRDKELKKQLRDQLRRWSDLELLNWSRSFDTYGYVHAKGQLKNISGRNLKNVEAMITYYDKNRNFITSDSALIEYNPILPGQISPFKITTQQNPRMNKASLEFKTLFGKPIKAYQK